MHARVSRLVVWLAVMAVCSGAVWVGPLARAGQVGERSQGMPLVVVRGLGGVAPASLEHACRALLSSAPVRCEIRPPRPAGTYLAAWNEMRHQYDGRVLLQALFLQRAGDAHVELLVTSRDMYEAGKPYVFGLASLIDRVAIISTARIEDGTSRTARRLAKLVLHEAGHTFGLGHHHDDDCVMRTDATVASLDTAPLHACPRCHARLVQRAGELATPGPFAEDRARTHAVGGGRAPRPRLPGVAPRAGAMGSPPFRWP